MDDEPWKQRVNHLYVLVIDDDRFAHECVVRVVDEMLCVRIENAKELLKCPPFG